MRRIRALALAVGLFLALTLSACEQPRPCADWGSTITWVPVSSGNSVTMHPIITPICERYEDEPSTGP